MNDQIIDQIKDLLSPTARKYLQDIADGRVPLTREPGINPLPDGLNATQVRALHQIAQANTPQELSVPLIVNSGILRTRGGGETAPRSEQELYNRLYNITSGATVGPIGPPDPAGQYASQRVPGEGSAQGRDIQLSASDQPNQNFRYPIIDPQSPKGRALQTIGNLLSPVYSNYLIFGEEQTGDESVTDVDKRFFDNVRANPFTYDLSQYSEYINENLGGNYQRRYDAVRDLLDMPADSLNAAENRYQEQTAFQNIQREFQTVPPTQQPVAPEEGVSTEPAGLVGRQIIGGDDATGMIGSRLIGGGAEAREPAPAATGVEDIEPGEAARPGFAEGMVGQTIIQDGQVTRVFGPSTAGDGTTGVTGDTTGGTGGGGGGVVVPETPAVPEEWEQAASEIYGAYYSIIKQNPEVAALIAQASAEKWGPEKFDYALEQTEWWRTTSLAIRTFDIEMQRDPATVQARIDALANNIQQTALDLNIRLTSETLNRLATDATRQGWTEQQLTNALGTEAIKAGTTGISALRYGFYGNKINEIAANYGVSISETEFGELVNKFAVGQENEQSLTSSFQTRATALFPAISERLMAGETFRNIVEPYRARASQILGRDFSATDFMDNDRFAQAVTYTGDDGKQRPMTYTEWGQYLRNTREFGYEYTDEAQSRAYQVANRIADIFGAV